MKYCTLLGVPWWDIDGQLILAPVDRLANARSGAGAGTSERRRELEVAGDTSYITSLSTIVRCIRATATVIVHTHTHYMYTYICIHNPVFVIMCLTRNFDPDNGDSRRYQHGDMHMPADQSYKLSFALFTGWFKQFYTEYDCTSQ